MMINLYSSTDGFATQIQCLIKNAQGAFLVFLPIKRGMDQKLSKRYSSSNTCATRIWTFREEHHCNLCYPTCLRWRTYPVTTVYTFFKGRFVIFEKGILKPFWSTFQKGDSVPQNHLHLRHQSEKGPPERDHLCLHQL